MKSRVMLGLWALMAILIAASSRHFESSGSGLATPTVGSGVTRSVLVAATPQRAPDSSLQLVRYVILPGTTLQAHVHPGTQIAYIDSGDLTYYVVDGSITVQRKAENGQEAASEVLTSGEHTVLHPGDSVIETEGMVHYGANLGTEPVVILSAMLIDPAEPASVVKATAVS